MQQDHLSDENLIQKYQQLGDIESLNLLFQRYLEKTYAFFRGQLNNRDDVSDLVQDVFMKVFRKIDSGKPIDSFKDYLFICCRNAFRDYLRQKNTAAIFQSEATQNGADSVAFISLSKWLYSESIISVSLKDLERIIEECIATISTEKVRHILSDYVHDYSLKEIARRHDCPVSTAGSIWHRHKDRLLKCILAKIERL